MLDGDLLLGHPGAPPALYKLLLASPRRVIDVLFSQMAGLFHRARSAFQAVTVYCLEDSSRQLWLSTGRERSLDVPGVPGAERLGRNPVQQFWVAFNLIEDQVAAQDLQWEGHKLVAATNAPKFIERLQQQETGARRQKEDERAERMDNFFFSRAHMEPPQATISTARGVLKSAQELTEEMRRWVVGDMDEHDLIVHQYRESVRQQHLAAERRQQELREMLTRTREELADVPTPLVAISAEHLDKLLAERGQHAGVSYIYKPNQQDRLLRETTPGNLQVVGNRVVDPSAQGDLDARTLQSLISGRHPSFGGGD
jgi:CheY-like chemotaxis protein